MLELLCDPPAFPARSKSEGSFHQIIRLTDGPETIAQAQWICGGDISEGVAQILELTVSPARRRQGHGRKVMDAITAQAKGYFQSRKAPLRRVWLTLEQKRQVIARSFLMKFGFHHVGTVHEMLKDEDMLVYMRTFD